MRVLLWGCCALASVGCAPQAPESMADLQFADDFRLDATALVSLRVDAPDGTDAGARLAVRTPDGRMLYDGGAALAARRGLSFALPETTRALDLTVHRDGALLEQVSIAITEARATYTLPGARR